MCVSIRKPLSSVVLCGNIQHMKEINLTPMWQKKKIISARINNACSSFNEAAFGINVLIITVKVFLLCSMLHLNLAELGRTPVRYNLRRCSAAAAVFIYGRALM